MSILSTLRDNKGKILLGSSLAAGLCYYFRDYYQVACAVYDMMNEEPPAEPPRVISAEREEKYKRTLNLADDSAQNQMSYCCKNVIQNMYHEHLDRVQLELRSKDVDEQAKKDLFAELQDLCFSRTIITITLTVLATLLARLESCILSRHSSQQNRDALKELIASCDITKDEHVITELNTSIRNLVTSTLVDFPPTRQVTVSDYSAVLRRIFALIPQVSFRLVTVPSFGLAEGRELQDLLNSPHWKRAVEISMSQCCDTLTRRTSGEGDFVMASRIGGIKNEFDFISRGQSQYLTQIDSARLTEDFFGLEDVSKCEPTETALLAMLEKMAS